LLFHVGTGTYQVHIPGIELMLMVEPAEPAAAAAGWGGGLLGLTLA
jgi:hypothetical protein